MAKGHGEFGARDLVQTLARTNRPDSTLHRKQYDDMERGVDIVDSHTIKFNMDSPNALLDMI